ncbi:MAG: menaquinol-cytochrome C reductase [Planctomycetota bacterium]|nr:MAG: menaquinol-cytochrome C reductase [Planctomycetota bacterium]
MNKLLAWLDDRTGYRGLMHEALYERIPGGARWRYVWGSSLVFCFFVQVVTGIFLWMAYSPSAQTAWESVYYIEFEMDGGSLLRGIHHYTAQLMVVLLALHLLQVVIDGAYRAPREINFWLGLVLMKIVLGLALTGYLLPWDQKGYWATQVATKIAGIVPLVGPWLQQAIVGGKEYGHHTLTRFFALHAGVLPGLLVAVLALHLALFRKHGLKAKEPLRKPETTFWPEQVLRDGVACLAVLVTVVLLSIFARAELGAPADPADSYDAARPEWYFLFLFQFLKFFHGETGELIGAIVVPGAVMLLLFLMPFIGRSQVGHWANVLFIFLVLGGAALLTGMAIYEDHHAAWTNADAATEKFADVRKMLDTIEADLRKNGGKSIYSGKSEAERIDIYAQATKSSAEQLAIDHYKYQAYRKSQDHIAANELAEGNAQRSHELAATGIPPHGALKLVHDDPKLQGPRLFAKHCASCHDHVDEEGNGIREPRPLAYVPDAENPGQQKLDPRGAPNLYGFATRKWLAGLLDPKRIAAAHEDKEKWLVADAPYFGNTTHRDGDMAGFVRDSLSELDAEGKATLEKVIAALSAEAALPAHKELDAAAAKDGTLEAGRTAIAEHAWEGGACIDCHKFHDNGDLGMAPELTGYGSRQWLIDFIGNPAHARFYEGDKNDRMPAFAADAGNPANNLLTRHELELIVDWLRGDWYRPLGD